MILHEDYGGGVQSIVGERDITCSPLRSHRLRESSVQAVSGAFSLLSSVLKPQPHHTTPSVARFVLCTTWGAAMPETRSFSTTSLASLMSSRVSERQPAPPQLSSNERRTVERYGRSFPTVFLAVDRITSTPTFCSRSYHVDSDVLTVGTLVKGVVCRRACLPRTDARPAVSTATWKCSPCRALGRFN